MYIYCIRLQINKHDYRDQRNMDYPLFLSFISQVILTQNICFLGFLQFDPPHSRLNTEFFKIKPTLRKVSDSCVVVRSPEGPRLTYLAQPC